jgi:hypothetical protein
MMVNREVKPLDAGRGPTRSTWMWLKRRVGTNMCCSGTCTWWWNLAHWQPRQAFAQVVTSVESPFNTYLEEMRWRVARRPRWAVPWRCSKTFRQRSLGTSGRNVPVDESPMRSRWPTFCVVIHSLSLERRACTCGQRIWQRAISLISRGALSPSADRSGPGGRRRQAGQLVHHHVILTWYIY